MKIEQFIISNALQFFRERIEKAYHIKCVNGSGYNSEAPCLFVGNYTREDSQRINNHKGLTFVRWEGSDTTILSRIDDIKGKEAVHLVDTHWLKEALERYGIKTTFVPMFLGDIDYYKPCPLGNKIYVYTRNPNFNFSILEQVKKAVPYDFIIVSSHFKYNTEELQEIYKQSFINLNLASFDGLSLTSCELGLMGRKSVWNGELPSAISYKTIEDIKNAILREACLRGTIQHSVARKTYKYLKKGFDWMEQDF